MQSLSTCISFIKFMEYSLKDVCDKTMFTITVLDILLLQGRSVLGPAQCIAESERVIFLVKNQKDVRLLLEVLEKRFSYKPRRFGMVSKLC